MQTTSTHTTAATTNLQAKEFADSVAAMVRERLARLQENQTLAYLEALNDLLGFELWVERMALEAIAYPEHDEATA